MSTCGVGILLGPPFLGAIIHYYISLNLDTPTGSLLILAKEIFQLLQSPHSVAFQPPHSRQKPPRPYLFPFFLFKNNYFSFSKFNRKINRKFNREFNRKSVQNPKLAIFIFNRKINLTISKKDLPRLKKNNFQSQIDFFQKPISRLIFFNLGAFGLAKSKVELSKALLRAAEKAKGTDNPGTGSDAPKKRKVTG